MQGHGNLAGGGMHAFASAEPLLAQRVGLGVVPPAAQAAAWRLAGHVAQAPLGVNVLKRSLGHSHIRAVAVDKIKPLKALPLKR